MCGEGRVRCVGEGVRVSDVWGSEGEGCVGEGVRVRDVWGRER